MMVQSLPYLATILRYLEWPPTQNLVKNKGKTYIKSVLVNALMYIHRSTRIAESHSEDIYSPFIYSADRWSLVL